MTAHANTKQFSRDTKVRYTLQHRHGKNETACKVMTFK